jgi:hypothetical protein
MGIGLGLADTSAGDADIANGALLIERHGDRRMFRRLGGARRGGEDRDRETQAG